MEDKQQQQQQQQQRQKIFSTDAKKAIAILEQKSKFPGPVHEMIDEAISDFLTKIEEAVHGPNGMIFYNQDQEYEEGEEGVKRRGLDPELDTEEQVETMIEFFPNVLSARSGDDVEYYPIFWSMTRPYGGCNVKFLPFVPLCVELGIRFGRFEEEEERGGLLAEQYLDASGCNALQYIAKCTIGSIYDSGIEHQHQLVDERCIFVLNRLKEMNLFRKEDIREQGLIGHFCTTPARDGYYFPEQRFRFLSDFDPTTLGTPCLTWTNPDPDSTRTRSLMLPIHFAAIMGEFRRFQVILEAGMRHYPEKLGFVFHVNECGETPYDMGCKRFGNDIVTTLILDRLLSSECCSCCPDNNISSAESLLLSLSTDDAVHLDGLYFFLRREPAAFLQLLQTGDTINSSSSSSSSSSKNASNTDNNERKRKRGKKKDSHDDDCDDDDHDPAVVELGTSRKVDS